MAKKKQPDTPVKEPQFRTTPFSSLKGVVAVSPDPTLEKPVPTPPAPRQADDGAELFLQAMEGVKRLQKGGQPGNTREAPPPVSVTGKPSAAPSPLDNDSAKLFLEEIGRLKLEVKFTDTAGDEDELKPLPGNRLRQVKRGIISIDRQLDLHGLTRDEALQELPRFLGNARSKGCTAVLVITGKGLNSPSEPVLQQAVASWLRDSGRELVVEFAPAPREMGGSGALVVFLRPPPKPAASPA